MPYDFLQLGECQPVFYDANGWLYTVDFDLGVDTDAAELIVMSVGLVEESVMTPDGSPVFELIFGIWHIQSMEAIPRIMPSTTGQPASMSRKIGLKL